MKENLIHLPQCICSPENQVELPLTISLGLCHPPSSMKLAFLFLGPMALLLLAGYGCVLGASSGNLRTFVGCAVREFTFLAKKPGCRGLRITTDACWGRCETWEKPILEPPYIEAHHRVCTYNETKHVTVKLPNCAPGVDPFYTYPVAIRCDCGACSTATTECETI
ncbi:glycoprotein hormone beta-5 isoform X1 [Pongo abelii]|nr:glycoprotein hormone beta-5 isoform X1 [Pongo abelii]XP_054386146.1 glycoprotein hormone beta-5 isoform X1 [Pongo abelii]XP_054386147.1 glycoprotein hormone beta-5 isoform X1 [Pongo abelii]XP_054386149.1 glycoprotein hormone beta-5 isoform X1 [Pongo abelii]